MQLIDIFLFATQEWCLNEVTYDTLLRNLQELHTKFINLNLWFDAHPFSSAFLISVLRLWQCNV